MPIGNSDKNSAPSERMEELGAKLRALREAQNLTYDDVTEAIHVRSFVLQAIEEGRVLEVADSVYARGFVKNYCEYLYADDLWGKYKEYFGEIFAEVSVRDRDRDVSTPVGIRHPTPIFRRSSMRWVYLVLLLAVGCAAYLLWWQQKERQPGVLPALLSQDGETAANSQPEGQGNGFASADSALSSDMPAAIYAKSTDKPPSSGQPAPNGVPANVSGASADLSWMDGGVSPVASGSVAVPDAKKVRYGNGNRLFIQITGAKCRLEVTRSGAVLTARTLVRGDVRSYDITGNTDVRFSDGGAALVEWRGRAYERIGENLSPVSFVFTPAGGMKLTNGKSKYGQ